MNMFRDFEWNSLKLNWIYNSQITQWVILVFLTSKCCVPVDLDKSLNSNWMVDTSAVLESGLHLGEWAMWEIRFTSEYGIDDGDFVKHGISREPMSSCKKLNKNTIIIII